MQRTHSAIFLLLAIALVATTFSSAQAQSNNEKPVQTPERVGVETADAMPLSLNEAIRLALENNNDIRTSRIDVEKAAFFQALGSHDHRDLHTFTTAGAVDELFRKPAAVNVVRSDDADRSNAGLDAVID